MGWVVIGLFTGLVFGALALGLAQAAANGDRAIADDADLEFGRFTDR
jgi:hypothetical protein